jgi:hypothetical protein
MLIVADTHVHVYRRYDAAAALHHGIHNLTALARRCGEDHGLDETLLALFLVEAEGCQFFGGLLQGEFDDRLPGWSVEVVGDEGAVWVGSAGTERVLLVAGRQLVTRDRLEVLALATSAEPPRDLELEETIEAVHAAGGVPVLSWAPGKWSFQRGERVAMVVEKYSPAQLLIGDSSLRARASEPEIMRRARQRGFKVVGGSDPLPIGGEERILGSYGACWQGEVERDSPLSSLRRMLLDPAVPTTVVGDRSTGLEVVSRLVRHKMAKKPRVGKRGSAND